MIWGVIGYLIMGTVGQPFLTGIISAVMAYKRGYWYRCDEFVDYVADLGSVRLDNQHTRYGRYGVIGVIVWMIFYIATWPVELTRCLFLDIPDAIEHYESLCNNGEA